MKRFKVTLPGMQIVLTLAAVAIDKSMYNGNGEGSNQFYANLVSNVEFWIKYLLGYDDVVNYNFRITTVILAVAFWCLIGLVIDKGILALRSKFVMR
jgi:hypothetical protein